ncbi:MULTISPECIES: hypothetical protein [Bacillus cereus group]|uniref:hypothetical protein n=1 Tax=Bacillus cereus group TaxID=86661 RepID=UPI000BFC5678|nr:MULTISPECIES: hypothetical protein [Bacillus cereus group]PGT19705.1 hypothetical protein COC96_06785 [Bacillus cereus]
MKKYLLSVSILLLATAACSPSADKSDTTVKEETKKTKPTEKDRDEYLSSNKYIREYRHTSSEDFDYLTVKMNDDFSKLKTSEQYLYLVDFYANYNKKYSELLPKLGFLSTLNVYLSNTEFPTYEVYLKTFDIVAMNINIDRELGAQPGKDTLQLLDTLDKSQIMSGTESGRTLAQVESKIEPTIKQTIISSSGEIKGALQPSTGAANGNSSSSFSNSNSDTETYIKGMIGQNWVSLTDNKKFHAISNALFSLNQNGYTVKENEYFYIEALNSFYIDSSTMNVPVNEALSSIGAMSNTITK